LSKTKELQNA